MVGLKSTARSEKLENIPMRNESGNSSCAYLNSIYKWRIQNRKKSKYDDALQSNIKSPTLKANSTHAHIANENPNIMFVSFILIH